MSAVELGSSAAAMRAAVIVAVLTVSWPGSSGAQVPGVAVLQNAFTSRGLAVAGNFGSSSGQSFFGGAAGWGLGERFLISGAAGAQRSNGATRGAYGGRATMGVWTSRGGALGAAAFAGIGGAARTSSAGVVTNPAVVNIPAGISLGYRRAMGARGSISGYVSPFYGWSRADSGTVASTRALRASIGVDVSFSSNLGASVGGEFGSGQGKGGVLGAAITYALGRR
jgi:hypothetical protein